MLADAPPAGADAPAVARLRAAGAVVVAKLHTQEFAHGPTGDVSATGPARNPHDRTRITGGSSSGSAAAVAAGHVPLALGTDTGCSVRTPAAHCGVVGLKPAYGHVSTAGVFPLAESLDHVGLLTADVHSAAVAWDVLDRAEGTGGGIQAPGVAGVRVGVLVDDYWQPADPAIAEGVAAAVALLEKAGARDRRGAHPDDRRAGRHLPADRRQRGVRDPRGLARRASRRLPAAHPRPAALLRRPAREGLHRRPAHPPPAVPEFRAAVDGVDVLVAGTTRLRATPIGQAEVDGVQVRPALLALALPFNLTGWPAVSVPAAVDGLPAGVQIVGRPSGGARRAAGRGGDRVGPPLNPFLAQSRSEPGESGIAARPCHHSRPPCNRYHSRRPCNDS